MSCQGTDLLNPWLTLQLEVRNTSILIPNTTINVPHIQLNGNPEPYFYHGVLWQVQSLAKVKPANLFTSSPPSNLCRYPLCSCSPAF